MRKILTTLFIVLFALILFLPFIKGDKGSNGNFLHFQIEKDTSVGGPFESTNSSSRYALTEAIVKRHTFFFTNEEAQFSSSDIVEQNGKYFSIFTPGVSFLGIPFYIIGDYFKTPQLATYSLNILATLLNLFLVYILARKLSVNTYLSLLSSAVFLFATNSLAYALTFTQHQISTMIILLALLNIHGKRTILKNLLLGTIFGIGALVDIPNIIVLLPVVFYAISKHFQMSEIKEKIIVKISPVFLIILFGLLPFASLFAWYNYQTAGSYTKVAQIIGRTDFPNKNATQLRPEIKPDTSSQNAKLPLQTRIQLNSLYILLISDERGWLYYSPVVIIGILGIFFAYRGKDAKHKEIAIMSSALILTAIIVYSMHGDPWGGWSFGPRYMIPASAIVSPFIGFILNKYAKSIFLTLLFFFLLFYSVNINIAGALTTNAIPPKGEAENLLAPIPYTYNYNFQQIAKNKSSSLLFNAFLTKKISLENYYRAIFASYLVMMAFLYGAFLFQKRTEKKL